jgi:hypothetical protein
LDNYRWVLVEMFDAEGFSLDDHYLLTHMRDTEEDFWVTEGQRGNYVMTMSGLSSYKTTKLRGISVRHNISMSFGGLPSQEAYRWSPQPHTEEQRSCEADDLRKMLII